MPRIEVDPSGNIVFNIKVTDEDGHPISLVSSSVTTIGGVTQTTQPSWFTGSTSFTGQVLPDGTYELNISFTWAAADVPREIVGIRVEATDNISPETVVENFTVDIADVPTITIPSDITNLVAHYSADTLTGYSDLDVIGEWPNLATGGVSLTQSTTASKPLYIATDEELNKPSVYFDSVDDSMLLNFSFGSDLTFFILAKMTEEQSISGDDRHLINYDTANPEDTRFIFDIDGGGKYIQVVHADGTGSGEGDMILFYHLDYHAGYTLYTLVLRDESSGVSKLFVDGVLKMYETLLGDNSPFLNIGEKFGGRIAEIIGYNRAVTGHERQEVERWIAKKYDLPIGPNPEFNPLDLDNLHAWYRASDIVAETHLEETDRVATWPDSGPNGYDLTTTTDAQRPTYFSHGGAGLPTVIFDGVGNYMRATFGTEIGSESTIILCGKALADANSMYFIDGIEATKRHSIYISPGQLSGIYQGSTLLQGDNLGYGDYTSISARFSDSGDSFHLNQREIVTGNTGSHTLSGITVGARYDNILGNFLRGEICEILVFNTAISHGLRQQLEAYLAWKYGTDFGVLSPNNP